MQTGAHSTTSGRGSQRRSPLPQRAHTHNPQEGKHKLTHRQRTILLTFFHLFYSPYHYTSSFRISAHHQPQGSRATSQTNAPT